MFSDRDPSGDDLPTVEVSDFGATGDGSTDDTDAIQAAVDSVNGKSVVAFDPGADYLVSSPITIDVAHVRGIEGRNARIIPDSDSAVLDLSGSHGSTANPDSTSDAVQNDEMSPFVSNVRIGSTTADPKGIGINATQTFGLRITGCQLFNLSSGIRIHGNNRNVIIDGNHVWHATGVGVHLDGGDLHQAIVNNNHIAYCDINVDVSSYIHNLQIVGNDIEGVNPPANATHNIRIRETGTGNVESVEIVGNTLDEHGVLTGANVLLESQQASGDRFKSATIAGNTFSNSLQEDIRLVNTKAVAVNGNTFEGSFTTTVKGEGRIESLAVSGNVVKGLSNSGQWEDSAGAGLVHMDGTFGGTEEYQIHHSIFGNQYYGEGQPILYETGDVGSVNISNNEMRIGGMSSFSGFAVDISGGDSLRGFHFKGNNLRLTGSSADGVRIGATTLELCLIKNNTVRDATTTALDLPAAEAGNVVVADNLSN